MTASTIPKIRLWWLANDERESIRIMVQEACLLNTEPSNYASTTAASVGNEQDGDDNFFSFQRPQVTSATVEDEVQRYFKILRRH